MEVSREALGVPDSQGPPHLAPGCEPDHQFPHAQFRAQMTPGRHQGRFVEKARLLTHHHWLQMLPSRSKYIVRLSAMIESV